MRIQARGGGGGEGVRTPPPPLKNHKNIWFLCNTCLDPLKNHKATKPAFNVGPSSSKQRNTILMAFRKRTDDGPIKAVFGFFIPPSTNFFYQIWTPTDKTFWIRMSMYIVRMYSLITLTSEYSATFHEFFHEPS